MHDNDTYKYYAFISFQHKDAKYALAIQRAIENYRLPTAILNDKKELPTHIRPCFCYLNDIHHTAELMQELRQRMSQSRYLIVICSPNSAKSPYVNAGIEYFISLGRRDSIIPVIIEGLPYSSDEQTECFPEALRRHFPKHNDPLADHSILGINFNEQGAGSQRQKRKRALLMIVARILGLEYNGLALRDRQRRKKRTIVITTTCLAVLIVLSYTFQSLQVRQVTIQTCELVSNDFLPKHEEAVMTLKIHNEIKNDTITYPDSVFVFNNIPAQEIGHQAEISFRSRYYLPIDTLITLQKEINLVLKRNPDYFGKIDIRIDGQLPQEPLQLYIENHKVEINNNSIKAEIPLQDQRTKYHVYSIPPYIDDTIMMPCGPNDIIEIQSKIIKP